MKIKFLGFLFLLYIGFSLSLDAQEKPNTFIVKGILVDSLTQQGEPYATIRIFKAADTNEAIHISVTDENGSFQEELPEAGRYSISLSAVGRSVVSRNFQLSEQKIVVDLGVMFISESSKMLKGVEVAAQKPLVKASIDKLSYNIEEDPDAQTNTVMEMLRKVPLVSVDGEDNIQIKGSSNFKIHVNGRPNNLMSNNPKEVLKSMPAHSIKSIEVITDPGAKYDAEGIGGILNIITTEKRGLEGYTATLNAGISNYDQNGGAYTTVQLGKFMLTGHYSYTHINSPESFAESGREDYQSTDYKYLSSKSTSKNSGNMQFGSIEGSYEMDSLHLLSFSLDLMHMESKLKGEGYTQMLDAQQLPAYSYQSISRSNELSQSIGASVDYQHSFKKRGEYLTLSYRYSATPQLDEAYTEYEDIKDYPYSMDYLRNQYYHNQANTDEHTFQLDYTNPINEVHDIAVGAKYILRNNSSQTQYFKEYEGVYQPEENLSDNYKRSQHILASYAEYKMNWKQWSTKAGLRYEHSFMDIKYDQMMDMNFKKNFDDVVPSMSISYQLAATQMLRASYNMRISRPSIWYLNPFRNTSDPTHLSYGNPQLDTEKSNRFSLSYSLFSPTFSIDASLNHSFVNNSIERYSFINNGVMESTFGNIGKVKRSYLSLWMNWNPWKKTRISVNTSGEYVDYRCDEIFLQQSNSGFRGMATLNIQQSLPWNIRLSMNSSASSPTISLQEEGFGFWTYSMNLSRSFLKEKRLRVSLQASSLFHKYRSFESQTQAPDFHSWDKNQVAQRVVGINISWRFGKLKASVKKTERSIYNDDLKEGGDNSGLN